jgi:DNA-binding MarR family transcriptional regulator
VSTATEDHSPVVASELMAVTAGIRRRLRRQLGRFMPDQPLSSAQVDLLLVVEAEPGIGVAAAARILHLAGNSVSALVNILVASELLRRETDPADRRAARLYLTPVARRRLTHHREIRAELVGRALDRVGQADREAIERALPALRRLLEVL